MELQILIQICGKLWNDYKTLNSYFADGQMVGILQEIGETDLQAAILALEAAKKSKQPAREVEEAIGHLRVASVRCIAAANKKRFFGLLRATGHARYNAYRVVVEGSLLTALCYRYLQDMSQAYAHLSQAGRYFEDYAEAELDDTYENERSRSGGIALEMSTSDSYVSSSDYEEQDQRIEATKTNIERERKSLKELIERASRPDNSLPTSLAELQPTVLSLLQ